MRYTRVASWLVTIALGFVVGLAAGGEEAAQLKGRIVGQKCAQLGKIGECYLKWAEPMVFWTEEGDYYAVDLSDPAGVRQEQLDEAFGQEVEIQGRIIDGTRIRLAQLNILRPAAGKEFFKG